MVDRDREKILGHLAIHGVASSQELQVVIGKSQATVSRVLSELSSRVLTLGGGRATVYGLPRPIRGLPAQQPVHWFDTNGSVTPMGVLTYLAGDWLHLESSHAQWLGQGRLPWFLQPLKVQGFLGKVHASRLVDAGVSADPNGWNLETVLFAALRLNSPTGAIVLGDHERGDGIDSDKVVFSGEEDLPAVLDVLASDVARHLPAGSSAGGEQPKFVAMLENERHVLVKFSPPRGSPFGERWHDLLHAECIALGVLAEWGVPVAATRVVESGLRTYLVSERFDRIGAAGRRHVVSIGEVHEAFVADAYSNWSVTAAMLARQGRLAQTEVEQVSALRAFGQLIGNTDMHSGNLALFVELQDLARGRFKLAPVFDMLPMRWRPNATLGGAEDYGGFTPDLLAMSSPALAPAKEFWCRLADATRVSRSMQEVAREMLGRLSGPSR